MVIFTEQKILKLVHTKEPHLIDIKIVTLTKSKTDEIKNHNPLNYSPLDSTILSYCLGTGIAR